MPAQNINDVVQRMESLILDTIAKRSRRGYFAALYYRVTCAVRDAILAGKFQDNERMEKLDVIFANRYFEALEQLEAGILPSRAWQAAIFAEDADDVILLQHLMLGMNAHINLDLGVAAARTCPGPAIHGLRQDFMQINVILAKMVSPMDHALDALCPAYRRMSQANALFQEEAINFSMAKARDSAWRLATRLAPLTLEQQVKVMGQQDDLTAMLGLAIRRGSISSRLMGTFESQDIVRNIEVLASAAV